MDYRVYSDTEKSFERIQQDNEDSYLFTEFSLMQDKKIKLIVVADGMGGLADGAKASRNAISGFVSSFYREVVGRYIHTDMEKFSLKYAVEDIKKIMIRSVAEANTAVCNDSDLFVDTGSTLTAVCIIDDCAVVANIGDSPAYYYNRNSGRLSLVSKLQTKAEQDADAGLYPRYSDQYYRNSHILYNSLGQYTTLLEEDIAVAAIGGLEAGDAILTGSDGCFGYMKESRICDMIEKCSRKEERSFLQRLFSLTRLDQNDDQTAVFYIVAEEDNAS